MTFCKERNDRFAGRRARASLKELWVCRVSRTVFVSPRATTGVATARRSRVCPFGFAGPLTVSPSRRPLSVPTVDTLRRCRERQVEGPRSRNRAPGSVVPALHLFRRSFAAGRGPASPFRCLPPRDPFAVPPGVGPFHHRRATFLLSHSSSLLSRRLPLPLLLLLRSFLDSHIGP